MLLPGAIQSRVHKKDAFSLVLAHKECVRVPLNMNRTRWLELIVNDSGLGGLYVENLGSTILAGGYHRV